MEQDNSNPGGAYIFKIGHGYDIHQLKPGGPLVIGGVEIPFSHRLKGHSDADVLIHAIIDSLLGAAGIGNIGSLFPDTDPRYHQVSSLDLLMTTYQKISNKNFAIGNIDCTIICQSPRLTPYVSKMKENICPILHCHLTQLSIKPKTNEQLDAVGQQKGISCFSVCLLRNTSAQLNIE